VQVFSFKLLNKRARLRVSESPVDLAKLPGKGDLLAVAPSRGWFAAVALQGEAERASDALERV
jgi:nucleoporin NUP159